MRLETEQMAAVTGGPADHRQGSCPPVHPHLHMAAPKYVTTHGVRATVPLPVTAGALASVLRDVPEHAAVTFHHSPAPSTTESVEYAEVRAEWTVGERRPAGPTPRGYGAELLEAIAEGDPCWSCYAGDPERVVDALLDRFHIVAKGNRS